MIEQLIELLKSTFEILDNAAGEKPVGYGFLMIIFYVGFIVLSYYALEFTYKICIKILEFLGNGFKTFAEIFKRAPSPQQINIKEEMRLIMESHNTLNDKIDKINKLNTEQLNKLLSEIKRRAASHA